METIQIEGDISELKVSKNFLYLILKTISANWNPDIT